MSPQQTLPNPQEDSNGKNICSVMLLSKSLFSMRASIERNDSRKTVFSLIGNSHTANTIVCRNKSNPRVISPHVSLSLSSRSRRVADRSKIISALKCSQVIPNLGPPLIYSDSVIIFELSLRIQRRWRFSLSAADRSTSSPGRCQCCAVRAQRE